jgi:hypothetical protein
MFEQKAIEDGRTSTETTRSVTSNFIEGVPRMSLSSEESKDEETHVVNHRRPVDNRMDPMRRRTPKRMGRIYHPYNPE